MIGRVFLAALLAGIAAGLIMSAIQHVRLTPLILTAEKYESAGAHEHQHGTEVQSAPQDAWAPQNGLERTLYTTLASVIAGAGFASLLAGVSILLGLRVTAHNGILWGLAGFIAVSLAPSAGLPPELPGMAAADLIQRQIWWVATIIATGAGIALIFLRSELLPKLVGVAMIALPHLIGAPEQPSEESGVPPALSAAFAANSIVAAAIFWCAIGGFLGLTMDRFLKDGSRP
jgi:cobalt transporter subunit CbtA